MKYSIPYKQKHKIKRPRPKYRKFIKEWADPYYKLLWCITIMEASIKK